ncbi:MAG: DUF502 domain-containing protein [Beijerinckiaceae bacterium]|nr:DUF502 domain-containing protein [Beijerinckiaceae bacterium]
MNQPPILPPPPATRHHTFGAGIRTWFLTGLIVAGPLALTATIVWWFISLIDGWVKPLVPASLWPDYYLPMHLPGVGVILAFLGLTMLGFLTANLAGRSLLKLGERILDRMPVVRSIYKSLKQIFETVFSQSGTGFRRVGLVQFPQPGMWSIVFISAPPSSVLADNLPAVEHMSVFLPCTPNPTTGFYFYLPASEVIEVPLTPDEAAKLIMSAGLIQPETQQRFAAMVESARKTPSLNPPAAA